MVHGEQNNQQPNFQPQLHPSTASQQQAPNAMYNQFGVNDANGMQHQQQGYVWNPHQQNHANWMQHQQQGYASNHDHQLNYQPGQYYRQNPHRSWLPQHHQVWQTQRPYWIDQQFPSVVQDQQFPSVVQAPQAPMQQQPQQCSSSSWVPTSDKPDTANGLPTVQVQQQSGKLEAVSPVQPAKQLPLVSDALFWKTVLAHWHDINSYDELEKYITIVHRNVLTTLPKLPNFQGTTHRQTDIFDDTAYWDMPHDHGLANPFPIHTTGDGNCFPNTLSHLVFGNEDHSEEMRVRLIIDAVLNKDHYLRSSTLEIGFGNGDPPENFVDKYLLYSLPADSELPKNTPAGDRMRKELYEQLTLKTSRKKSWCNLWQFHQAANVLQCTVKALYPDMRRHEKIMFHRQMLPLGQTVPDAQTVHIMSCRMSKMGPSICNHYVPVVEQKHESAAVDDAANARKYHVPKQSCVPTITIDDDECSTQASKQSHIVPPPQQQLQNTGHIEVVMEKTSNPPTKTKQLTIDQMWTCQHQERKDAKTTGQKSESLEQTLANDHLNDDSDLSSDESFSAESDDDADNDTDDDGNASVQKAQPQEGPVREEDSNHVSSDEGSCNEDEDARSDVSHDHASSDEGSCSEDEDARSYLSRRSIRTPLHDECDSDDRSDPNEPIKIVRKTVHVPTSTPKNTSSQPTHRNPGDEMWSCSVISPPKPKTSASSSSSLDELFDMPNAPQSQSERDSIRLHIKRRKGDNSPLDKGTPNDADEMLVKQTPKVEGTQTVHVPEDVQTEAVHTPESAHLDNGQESIAHEPGCRSEEMSSEDLMRRLTLLSEGEEDPFLHADVEKMFNAMTIPDTNEADCHADLISVGDLEDPSLQLLIGALNKAHKRWNTEMWRWQNVFTEILRQSILRSKQCHLMKQYCTCGAFRSAFEVARKEFDKKAAKKVDSLANQEPKKQTTKPIPILAASTSRKTPADHVSSGAKHVQDQNKNSKHKKQKPGKPEATNSTKAVATGSDEKHVKKNNKHKKEKKERATNSTKPEAARAQAEATTIAKPKVTNSKPSSLESRSDKKSVKKKGKATNSAQQERASTPGKEGTSEAGTPAPQAFLYPLSPLPSPLSPLPLSPLPSLTKNKDKEMASSLESGSDEKNVKKKKKNGKATNSTKPKLATLGKEGTSGAGTSEAGTPAAQALNNNKCKQMASPLDKEVSTHKKMKQSSTEDTEDTVKEDVVIYDDGTARCTLCDNTYKTAKIARKHVVKHYYEYPCEFCNKTCTSSPDVKSHHQSMHPEETFRALEKIRRPAMVTEIPIKRRPKKRY